jgi:glutamate racemase
MFHEASDRAEFPIAVFDSGVGGLTVLKSLAEDFPNENFLYLGDSARLPYGTKSPLTIRHYVEQNIQFLLNCKVKAIVVACNSASSVLDLERKIAVPLYEVIGPGARTAYKISQTLSIGVIATRATVNRGAYVRALHELDPRTKVFQQACPLLVPLVEEGWVQDPLTNLVIHRYLSPIATQGIDTLILGCTHYPILKESIAKVMGGGVTLVDSGQAISTEIMSDMSEGKLKANPAGSGKIEILNTDLDQHIQFTAEKILHPFKAAKFTHVNLTTSDISKVDQIRNF